MKFLPVIILLLFIGFYSCGEAEKEIENEAGIVLNEGKKWEISSTMTPFIIAEEEMVNTYLENEDDDYKTLAANLKTNNSQVISNCKMKGTAHDELHKWLLPHLDLVKELEAATSVEESSKTVEKIESSLRTFNHFFE